MVAVLIRRLRSTRNQTSGVCRKSSAVQGPAKRLVDLKLRPILFSFKHLHSIQCLLHCTATSNLFIVDFSCELDVLHARQPNLLLGLQN